MGLAKRITTLLLVVGTLVSINMSAFSQSLGMIEGVVYDAESQQPLIGASVYLSRTTLGDATDKDGYFEISNVPEGSYNLVISFLGYGTSYREIKINDSGNIFIEEVLSPQEEQLGDIEVRAKRDRGWERNLARFERAFIGNSQNAKRTEIKNPEVINFSVRGGMLEAESSERIEIINNALGYQIDIDLISFEWDHINDRGSTTYFSRFSELEPDSDDQLETWLENRKKTYFYSPERLFRKIIKGNITEEDYKVFGGRLYKRNTPEKEYSLFEQSNVIQAITVRLVYSAENLQIEIQPREGISRKPEIGVIQHTVNDSRDLDQLYVDLNGNILNPLDFSLGGIWYDYRVAEKLPLTYRLQD